MVELEALGRDWGAFGGTDYLAMGKQALTDWYESEATLARARIAALDAKLVEEDLMRSEGRALLEGVRAATLEVREAGDRLARGLEAFEVWLSKNPTALGELGPALLRAIRPDVVVTCPGAVGVGQA